MSMNNIKLINEAESLMLMIGDLEKEKEALNANFNPQLLQDKIQSLKNEIHELESKYQNYKDNNDRIDETLNNATMRYDNIAKDVGLNRDVFDNLIQSRFDILYSVMNKGSIIETENKRREEKSSKEKFSSKAEKGSDETHLESVKPQKTEPLPPSHKVEKPDNQSLESSGKIIADLLESDGIDDDDQNNTPSHNMEESSKTPNMPTSPQPSLYVESNDEDGDDNEFSPEAIAALNEVDEAPTDEMIFGDIDDNKNLHDDRDNDKNSNAQNDQPKIKSDPSEIPAFFN